MAQERLMTVDFYIEPLVGSAVFMGYSTLAPTAYGGTGSGLMSNKSLMQALTFVGASVMQKLAFNQDTVTELDESNSIVDPNYGIRALRTGLLYSTLSSGLDNDSRSFVYKTLLAAGADYVGIRLEGMVASKLNVGVAVTGDDDDDDSVTIALSSGDASPNVN